MKGESSWVINEVVTWQEIWKMHVPGVVKTFIWKAVHNILPTKHNLKRKNIIESFLAMPYK